MAVEPERLKPIAVLGIFLLLTQEEFFFSFLNVDFMGMEFFYREFYFTFITSYCEIRRRKKEEMRKNVDSRIYLLYVKSMNIYIGCFANRGQFKLIKILRATTS